MTSINFYKITSTNTDKVYVGSTKKDINERLQNHEAHYRLFKDGKYHNVTSFEILECKDYKIELLENKVCQSKEERDTVECKYIINTPNTVNKYLPGRTPEQYRQDNKEQLDEYQRQYRQENKEQLDEYQRQYRQENKEEIKQKANEKHDCPCGGKFTKSNKSRHDKTHKHQTFIRNQQPLQQNAQIINNYFYNAPNQ
jgi:hypothetical protein